MLRIAIAVVVGYVLWTAIWLGSNFTAVAAMPDAFDEAGLTTSNGLLAGFLGISVIASLLSGMTAAAISPAGRSTTAAMILGVLLLLTGIGVQVSVWDQMPLWYHVLFLVLLLPVTLLGARLRALVSSGSHASARAT